MDAKSLQLHIDYLHNPHNRFAACCILAAHGIEDVDRSAIYRDIMALVQLYPRDAAWEECHRKLNDLVESDGGTFYKRQGIPYAEHLSDEFHQLWTKKIQVEKDNIRYAIHVLGGFLDGEAHTVVN